MTDPASITLDDIQFPAGYGRGRRQAVPESALITESFPLTAEHVEAAQAHIDSGASLGVSASNIKHIRATHHRLAQLLAGGMDETRAAKFCNYSVSRVSILKSDPAFIDLMAFYQANVDEEFLDFVTASKALTMDLVQHVQQQLDESPEKFTPSVALDAIKTLADRTGHAPVQKSINVNVNADSAKRLKRARERLAAVGVTSGPSVSEVLDG